MQSFYLLLLSIIDIYTWVIIISIVLSWLIQFNVVNTGNRFVYLMMDFLSRVTEPALAPIRNALPNLGGIDISPVILILLLIFFRNLIYEYGLGGPLY